MVCCDVNCRRNTGTSNPNTSPPYIGDALEWADPDLQGDREMVLAAVMRHGRALWHASEEFRADREVVLAAAGQDGRALRHATPLLRADRILLLILQYI